MMTIQEQKQLEFIFNSYFNKLLVDTARLLVDVVERKGWFLFLLKEKIEILKNVDDANLLDIGQILLQNLHEIKNFDFLTKLINSLYSTDSVTFENDFGGEISLIRVDVNANYESVDKIYNAFSGDEKIYQGNFGDEKIYQRVAVLNDTDLFEFLPQFILKGVRIKAIEIVDNTTLSQVYHNGVAVLHSGETVFI